MKRYCCDVCNGKGGGCQSLITGKTAELLQKKGRSKKRAFGSGTGNEEEDIGDSVGSVLCGNSSRNYNSGHSSEYGSKYRRVTNKSRAYAREEMYYSQSDSYGGYGAVAQTMFSGKRAEVLGMNMLMHGEERMRVSNGIVIDTHQRANKQMMEATDTTRVKAKAALGRALQENRAYGFAGSVDAIEKSVFEELCYSSNDYLAKMRDLLRQVREANTNKIPVSL